MCSLRLLQQFVAFQNDRFKSNRTMKPFYYQFICKAWSEIWMDSSFHELICFIVMLKSQMLHLRGLLQFMNQHCVSLQIWFPLEFCITWNALKSFLYFMNCHVWFQLNFKAKAIVTYRVSHSIGLKVILLWWGYRFWFLLLFWILHVPEIGAFMPNSSVFIFLMLHAL